MPIPFEDDERPNPSPPPMPSLSDPIRPGKRYPKKREPGDWFALIATGVILYGLLGAVFILLTAGLWNLAQWAF